MERKY